jgi:hypothetical protein
MKMKGNVEYYAAWKHKARIVRFLAELKMPQVLWCGEFVSEYALAVYYETERRGQAGRQTSTSCS